MLTFINNNISTIIVGLLLLALIAAITVKLIKDKKAGKGGCSCGCAGCPMAGQCHKGKSC